MATNKESFSLDEDVEYSSGSDFDDDEDPDKIEVPGGGKDLATSAGFGKLNKTQPSSGGSVVNVMPNTTPKTSTSTKLPAGLISKPNTTGFDIIKPNMGQGMPYGMGGTSGMMGMGMGLGPMAGYYSGSNMAASLLAQSKSNFGKMEMAGLGFVGMSGANPMGANAMQHLNQFMIQNLQSLIAANPNFLTGGIPNKLLSQMWTEPAKAMSYQMQPQEEEEHDDEEMGVAETYADYWPAKLKLGKKHPDAVVETASLSSVEPTDVTYKLSIPAETINAGLLSALQLESITYASQAHEQLLPDGSRAGFLIGDGAGVGKGRTIAGIIYENYLKGRKKALWISVSNDLKYDAERDLHDIGASKIEVHRLNKFKYAKISSAINGNVKKGVVFSTYSALIGESNNSAGKYKSRLKQLLQWCGEDFDGCIVFDECHKAKNLCPTGSSKPTKTGLTALDIQNKLPKARVVYASATGASEPRNMAYMVRLGMWGQGTPFKTFNDFISAVEKRGVGAMEIVAMDMKLRGMYIARQLSFHGVTFKIEEVPLSKEFEKVYDESVLLWVEAMQKFTEAAELIDAESRMKKTMWGQFWSAHQRFFKYLCIAAKVNHAVIVAREAIKYGKCVVIGLQSTGEARTLEQLEREDGELSDFVSTAKGVIQSLVEKHFPAPDRNRISRLLGLDAPQKTQLQAIMEEPTPAPAIPATTSSNKRKSSRQAAQRTKRNRRGSSDASDNSDDGSDISEFKASESESDDSIHNTDSNQSSDFNPFHGGDSDSDADPWVSSARNKKKKVKKVKAVNPKKKTATTQEKIQQLITKKQTEMKPVIQTNGYKVHTGPPPKDAIERACSLKEELLYKIEKLGDKLPPNTLDQLIDELGGPENVAEMTGRKGRVIQTDNGHIQYESRSEQDVPLETLNLTEKQRFMDGEKDVAIISEAASSGISLQSDRRVRNQRRRVHITLELPWSADRAVQQFGRTHRSNQVNAPEYIFLISDLAGERRFASTVAKRLESLGALTHGDRRATETRDLSQFNIDNKYGRSALEAVMKTIMGYESPLVPPPLDYKGDFFKDIAGALVGVGLIVNSEAMPGVLSLDKDYNNISKFLNRILGMPVELQNRLFKYFTDTLAAIIGQAKKMGRFDLGILDLGTSGENVTRVKMIRFIRKHATGIAPTELHTVSVERGMIWQEAIDKWADLSGEKEGFYLSNQSRNGKQTAVLAFKIDTGSKKKSDTVTKKEMMFQLYRPNTGLQFRPESLAEIEKKYKKVQSDEAEAHWTQQYDSSVNICSHAYWRGNCRNVSMGQECEVGLRRRTYTVLSGSVLAVWARVEQTLNTKCGASNNKMQVIRLKTTEGNKIVGTLIPKNCVETLVADLSSDAEKFKYAKISSAINGNVKKGVVFSTYSALIGESNNSAGKYKSRLKQLLQWCGEDFDGCIVFDECHKAKNLCPTGSSKPTKTGLTALDIQNKLPKARVVYASATGASEPRNMAYMVRLGMWGQGTPFKTFNDFISAVEKRGVGAMEIVAMDMKLRGMYIARQLSFHGVTFKIEEVPLSKEFEKVYDESVLLWVEAMQKFTEAAELIDAESRMKKTMWGQFWSAHQRFFKYLCIAAKANHAVIVAREAIKYGKCVVIGLQSTGEARTLEQLEREDGELSDFVSTAKGVIQSLVEKHFPAPDRNRISRLLGLDAPQKTQLQAIMEEPTPAPAIPATTSSNKRKSSRQAAQRTKRNRRGSSDASDNSDDGSDISEFKASESESDDSIHNTDSNQSSDFNPFHGGDSDSDADPWVSSARNKKKKVKKVKAVNPKKKTATTQEKIQQLITKKQTEMKPVIQTNGYKVHTGPPPKDAIERACSLKEELLYKIEKLGDKLPPNTLDQLIDELGGPENVAEMTGRKGRVIQTDNGHIQYESRSEQDVPLETLNLTEKQRFMDGEKDVAIISEAASSGISLQSDRRVRNQRRRVHITLELPWSADRAVQQFGRTHRSNQVNAPEYIFLISDLAGERRFASTVAKRLESLGALTHGDRRATETRDLSQFNIDNKYGRSALEAVMKTIMGYESPLVPPPLDYKGDFFKDIAGALVGVGLIVNSEAMPGVLSLDKDYNNISKFLNRILGMPVELQNRLFKYFTDTLAAIIGQAKKMGRFDLGILDLGTSGENVTRVKMIRFIRKHATGIAPTELHTVSVERGMIWQEAIDKWADLSGEKEGFYLSNQSRNGKQTAVLAFKIDTGSKKKSDTVTKKEMMFQLYRPNTGLQFRPESLAEIEKKYKKVQSDEAEAHWTQQYDSSVNICSHAYWRGNCRNVSMGQECEVGLRRRTYTVLSGSVLAVWARVEQTLNTKCGASNNKMQVIRLKTTEGNKIVGTLIPKNCVETLVADLSSDAEKVEEQTFTTK